MLQIQGVWKTKNQNMADLCKVAKDLKDKFVSFQINHVLRVQACFFCTIYVIFS